MKGSILPEKIERIFEFKNLDLILSKLMVEIVNLLQCDRCFLYVRDPETRLGKTAFCYCRDQTIPDVTNDK